MNVPLRIGLVTNYHMECMGGAEEANDQLASLWHAAGHRVRFFSTPPRADRTFHRRPWQPAYPVVMMPRPFSTRFGLSRYVRILREHCAREPFDVVLAVDTYWAGHVAHCFSKKTGVPFVISCQGVGLIEGCRFAARWLTRRRLVAAIGGADGLITPSRYIHERALALTTPRGLDRVIPNGWPDHWADQPKAPRVVQGRYAFGMGRLIPLKGFHTLVEGLSLVRARHPDVGLVIGGDGPALPDLKSLARARGWNVVEGDKPPTGSIAGTAWFPGVIHGDLKRSLIGGATVAVSPSIRQEPMSLVLFELLSCGIPVIGSAVGGTPDIVQPGVNGELFAAEKGEDLAGKLDRVLADDGYRGRLAAGALSSVAPFRWSVIAERFLETFREVIDRRKRMAA